MLQINEERKLSLFAPKKFTNMCAGSVNLAEEDAKHEAFDTQTGERRWRQKGADKEGGLKKR